MIEKQQILKDVVDQNSNLSLLINRFGIKEPLTEVTIEKECNQRGIDSDFFVEILNLFNDTNYFPQLHLQKFPIVIIIDYLLKTHKYYVDKRLLELEQSAENLKVNFPEYESLFYLLHKFIVDFRKRLTGHIIYEEKHLFPYILDLIKVQNEEMTYKEVRNKYPSFNIDEFKLNHHDDIENKLQDLETVLNTQFTSLNKLPAFSILLTQVSSFEKDLRIHGFVEDKVLIPRAERIEMMVID